MAAPNDDAVIANVPFASPPATPTAVAPTAAAAAGGGGAAAAPPAEVEALANAVATTAIGPSSAAARAADQKPIGDDLVATIVTTNNLSLMEKKSLFVDGVKIDIGVGLEWADLEDEDKVVASGFGVKGCKIDRIAYPQ